MPPLDPKYVPADHEPRVAERWQSSRAFHAEPSRVLSGDREPYCVLIPPPNVTARLHLGHALVNSLQDILVRAHRMKGYETLWMPGTDHAGIATQTVVDKRLKAAGQPSLIDYKREEAASGTGRDTFVEKVQQWKDDYEEQITDQLKAMGASCDWDRQRFTMDEVCARAVREAFFRLFKDGLIYRGKRLVNWDPVTQTALADDEVEMEDVDSFFWYMKYPVVDDAGNETGEHVTVATTRPETYFGDTAVAVNPDDPERARFIGTRVRLPFVGRVIPVIGDDYVVVPDAESSDTKAKFASGFLKVTPAHDTNDYEIGNRHDLERINVMAPDASISDQHGWSDVGEATWAIGKSREEARALVEEKFREAGLLAGKKEYTHAVGHSYRSHVPVEPYLSDQWYCKVSDDRLVGSAQRALKIEQRIPSSLGGTGLRPVSPLLDTTKALPVITPPLFESRDPYPRGEPSTNDLMGGIRNLPHLEMPGATYFVTWRLRSGTLGPSERAIVVDALGHWHNKRCQVYALCVMPDHVHAIVRPFVGFDLGTWVASVKKYSALTINRSRGTSGPLWMDERFDHIIRDGVWFESFLRYVLHNPVESGLVDRADEYDAVRVQDGLQSLLLKHRSETGATRRENGDNGLSFSPDRYAKTYEAWHDGLRDWCISRQLWWGHRIPVWTRETGGDVSAWEQREDCAVAHTEHHVHVCPASDDDELIRRLEEEGFVRDPDVLDTWFSSALWPLSTMGWPEGDRPIVNPHQIDPADASSIKSVWVKRVRTFKEFIGTEGEYSGELIDRLLHLRDNATTADGVRPIAYQLFREAELRAEGVNAVALTEPEDIQEADDLVCAVGIKETAPVESTKFGAIHVESLLLSHGFTDTAGLLDAFNPSTVLCTGRDIITLWVSRMVMFNRYFKGGDLPFRDVYINPIVQDGHGQRMSKSLGNGVDPLDIVHSHGADALRIVLCQIATATQDVRMPVDTVCPHTGEVFEPETTVTGAGRVVAAPIQTSPKNPSKKMVTAYGVASGLAEATDETPLARNTSSRFDAGRNICTKLWNATRFGMLNLEEVEGSADGPVSLDDASLVDRWMLGRLVRAVEEIDEAIATYQFARYADLVYDLFWRDFCDWYLEAVKPTLRSDPVQRAVFRAAIDVILRVFHPITPFITEVLYEHLRGLPQTGTIDGLTLGASELLCTAPWPVVDGSLYDEGVGARWQEVQSLVEAIRQLRAQQNITFKQKLTLHAPEPIVALVRDAGEVVPTLAGLSDVTTDAPEGASVELLHEGVSLRLSGLDEGVDPAKLRSQLADREKKLAGEIRGLEGRLNNPGYVNKAPAHLVEETKGQLASKQAERAEIEQRLKDLA